MGLYFGLFIILSAVLAVAWFIVELILFLCFKGIKRKAILGSFIASAIVFGVLLLMSAFVVILFMVAITNM